MDVQPLRRHQRQQGDRGTHELVEPAAELVDGESRARLLGKAEESHDLRQALAEHEVLAARQHRHRAHTQRLQLGKAGWILEDIH